MDTFKCKKEIDKVFHCNDIAQIIVETCGISRRQIFSKKERAPALNQGRKFIYLDNFGQRFLSYLVLNFFSQLWTVNRILAECFLINLKQLPGFPVMSKNALHKCFSIQLY